MRTLAGEAGLLVSAGRQDGNVVRLQPLLVISQAELDGAIDTVLGAIQAVRTGAPAVAAPVRA